MKIDEVVPNIEFTRTLLQAKQVISRLDKLGAQSHNHAAMVPEVKDLVALANALLDYSEAAAVFDKDTHADSRQMCVSRRIANEDELTDVRSIHERKRSGYVLIPAKYA